MSSRFLYIILFLTIEISVEAQRSTVYVDTAQQLIDGTVMPYSALQPGDTIYLQPGKRNKLLIRNLQGTEVSPILIVNNKGEVEINTSHYYGISVSNCRHIRLSGQGDPSLLYGIRIAQVTAGAGVGISNFSSSIELDHLQISHCYTAGIYAKTDPDCSFAATREKFTQFNTSIHDNLISYTGNEGMYIGSSFYNGLKLHCNGKDTIVYPPLLSGVQVYNNIITHTGWDAIQVSSAASNCQVYKNNISYDSDAGQESQMAGILLGGGSACDCNNNLIRDGKGDGIEDHGLGGNRIFNNIIVDAGRTYQPANPALMKHGIFVSDISVRPDSAFTIVFNTIIRPKSDGIRFQSSKSRNSLIASNLITEPGNYAYYESQSTQYKGEDAYVMIPVQAVNLQLQYNYYTLYTPKAGITESDFSILPGSPLINAGYPFYTTVQTDFAGNRRWVGRGYDIGAYEFQGGADTLRAGVDVPIVLFPNPVNDQLTIRYQLHNSGYTMIQFFSLNGWKVAEVSLSLQQAGAYEMQLNVARLAPGAYTCTVSNGTERHSAVFIRQ